MKKYEIESCQPDFSERRLCSLLSALPFEELKESYRILYDCFLGCMALDEIPFVLEYIDYFRHAIGQEILERVCESGNLG